jgi:hypothetical protein
MSTIHGRVGIHRRVGAAGARVGPRVLLALIVSLATAPASVIAVSPQDWVRSMARDLPEEVFQKPQAPSAPTPARPSPSAAADTQADTKASSADGWLVIDQRIYRLRFDHEGASVRELFDAVEQAHKSRKSGQ